METIYINSTIEGNPISAIGSFTYLSLYMRMWRSANELNCTLAEIKFVSGRREPSSSASALNETQVLN